MFKDDLDGDGDSVDGDMFQKEKARKRQEDASPL